MDTSPIIDRLQSSLANTGWVLIAGAAELDAAIDSTPAVPAAYVLPLAETAEPSDLVSLHSQRVLQGFAVVVCVANLRDPRGAAAAGDLHTRRMAVRAALVGWAPVPTDGEAVSFAAGRLLKFEAQRLWWTDEFTVLTTYRA